MHSTSQCVSESEFTYHISSSCYTTTAINPISDWFSNLSFVSLAESKHTDSLTVSRKATSTWTKIIWRADPLLRNDLEISDYTTAATMSRLRKQAYLDGNNWTATEERCFQTVRTEMLLVSKWGSYLVGESVDELPDELVN
jgi:hypothetical protein